MDNCMQKRIEKKFYLRRSYITLLSLMCSIAPIAFGMKRAEPSGTGEAIAIAALAKRSKTKVNPLCEAIRQNNRVEIRRLLEDIGLVNKAEDQDLYPLYFAILKDDLELVKALLLRISNPHDTLIIRAKMLACIRGNAPLAEFLYKTYPNISANKYECIFLKKLGIRGGVLDVASDFARAIISSNRELIEFLRHPWRLDSNDALALCKLPEVTGDIIVELVKQAKAELSEEMVMAAYEKNKQQIVDYAVVNNLCLDGLLFVAAKANDEVFLEKVRKLHPDQKQADLAIFSGAFVSCNLVLMRETFARGNMQIDLPLSPLIGAPGFTALGYIATSGKFTANWIDILIDEFKASVDAWTHSISEPVSVGGTLAWGFAERRTPFMAAILCGHLGHARAFLKRGARLEQVQEVPSGRPYPLGQALMIVIYKNNEQSVKFLIECGAEIPAKEHRAAADFDHLLDAALVYRDNLLADACRHGKSDDLKKMLALGWLKPQNGEQLLQEVVKGGQADSLGLLLDAMNSRKEEFKSVIEKFWYSSSVGMRQLVKKNDLPCCRVALKKVPVLRGLTPVNTASWFGHCCVLEGNTEALTIFLNEFPRAKNFRYHGQTYLMQAVNLAELECVKVLLKHKVNIYLVDKNGRTALDIARKIAQEIHRLFVTINEEGKQVIRDDLPTIIALLEEAMDPFDEVFDAVVRQHTQGRAMQLNCHDKNGRSLLMRALIERNRTAVLFLLAQDIQLAKTDVNGRSALIHAVLTGERDWVALIMQNHSYYSNLVKTLNDEIVTAVRIAAQYGFWRVLSYLVEQLPDTLRKDARELAFSSAVAYNKKFIVKNLVAQGVQPNIWRGKNQDHKGGLEPTMGSLGECTLKMAEFLVSLGANPHDPGPFFMKHLARGDFQRAAFLRTPPPGPLSIYFAVPNNKPIKKTSFSRHCECSLAKIEVNPPPALALTEKFSESFILLKILENVEVQVYLEVTG